MYQIGGMGQMTPAMQQVVRKAVGKSGTATRSRRTKKKRAAKSVRKTRTKRTSSRKSGKKLVAGSAAAKAWGKKMKALRKKRSK